MSLLYKLEYQDNFTDLEKSIANYIQLCYTFFVM